MIWDNERDPALEWPKRPEADWRPPRPGRRIRRSRSAPRLRASHQARRVTSSPSSRKLRVSPRRQLDRLLAAAADLEQRAEPVGRCRSTSVPVPIRSPGWRLQPFELWWATICAALQYIAASADPRDRMCGASPPARICSVDRVDFELDAERRRCRGPRHRRDRASGCGSPSRRAAASALRNGASACGADDPRADAGQEILGEERPERLIFPRLEVARRPVVEQAIAGDMLGRLADRDRLSRARCRGRPTCPSSSS